MSEREIYKTMVASTGHMAEADNALLMYLGYEDPVAGGSKHPFIVRGYEYGWRVFVGSDPERVTLGEAGSYMSGAEERGLSPEFVKLMSIAAGHGCRWLELDCDGPLYDGLPTFEW